GAPSGADRPPPPRDSAGPGRHCGPSGPAPDRRRTGRGPAHHPPISVGETSLCPATPAASWTSAVTRTPANSSPAGATLRRTAFSSARDSSRSSASTRATTAPPVGLTEDEESRLAIDAVGRLRAVGYHVDCDEPFDTEARPAAYPTLGASVSHLAERLREATDTAEAADILTELTAPHDGILAGFEETLGA